MIEVRGARLQWITRQQIKRIVLMPGAWKAPDTGRPCADSVVRQALALLESKLAERNRVTPPTTK